MVILIFLFWKYYDVVLFEVNFFHFICVKNIISSFEKFIMSPF
jgi:hypothetical protein